MDLLTVHDVSVAFGGLQALSHVTVRVEADAIHGLIGPNGAGKSTLFHVLAGTRRPRTGRVVFAGEEITHRTPHRIVARGLARTFQTTRLFPTMTVRENIVVGHHIHTRARLGSALLQRRRVRAAEEESHTQVERILDMLGLGADADRPAVSLPYGRQRLVEIGRALATRPHLLLLDEPSAGMTPAEATRLMEILRRLRGQGTTLLVVEHDMRLIMGISDVITVLDFGVIIATGAPAEIRRDPAVIRAYLGSAGVH